MTTERMTDVKNTDIVDLFEDERWDALRDVSLRLNRENASLREQLRLANDKMAERERLARHDVASEVLEDVERFKDLDDVLEFLHKVRIANAPKD